MFRDRAASGLGSVLEWYDFSLYGFFAPILAQLYFPNEAPNIALVKTFAVFTIGFMARPIGAFIFGYIGDKYGRAKCLKLTPLLITLPTLGLALLPTYQQIGVIAPIALIVLRILQGICIGGEYANNIVYLCETTTSKKLYFAGSIGSCTASLGILLASSIATLWYGSFAEAHLDWAWRIAFAISLPIGTFTYWLRRNILETPVFNDIVKLANQNPIVDSWKLQWQDYLLAIGLTFLPATAFYFVFIFLPNYLSTLLTIKPSDILADNSISLLGRLMIIPLLGFVADKIGGIKVAQLASILFILVSIPIFYQIIHFYETLGYLIYILVLLTALNAATTPGLLIELLNPKTRCTILSFTLNLCFGVLGGIVPFVGFLLLDTSASEIGPACYLVFAGIITFISTLVFKTRKRKNEEQLQLLADTY